MSVGSSSVAFSWGSSNYCRAGEAAQTKALINIRMSVSSVSRPLHSALVSETLILFTFKCVCGFTGSVGALWEHWPAHPPSSELRVTLFTRAGLLDSSAQKRPTGSRCWQDSDPRGERSGPSGWSAISPSCCAKRDNITAPGRPPGGWLQDRW